MNKKTIVRSILLTLLALTFLVTAAAAYQGTLPIHIFLPSVYNAKPTLALPPADGAANRITVPPGFSIRIYAQDLSDGPRLMAIGPDGWLYAPLPGDGSIVRLPDRNRDGLADSVEMAATGLTAPHNLEWHDGWMYVAQTGRIDRLSDSNSDGFYETHEPVTNNIPGSGGHSSRTLHFGPDGKLYVSTGSSSNINPESDPRRAAILRFNPDGSIPTDNPFATDPDPQKRPLWAWGLRNSVDFLWLPNGTLLADHNGSDGISDSLPPEEILIPVQGNRTHGWPYCYTAIIGLNSPTQPEVRDTRVSLPAGFDCSQAVPALLTGPAHAAPLGMSLAAPGNFPAAYLDDIFIAFHGSWNTNNPANYRDCKVERIVIENGQVVRSETFANGWRAPDGLCGSTATYGRPADVVFGPDGAMYISDDHANRIYRVIYTGQ